MGGFPIIRDGTRVYGFLKITVSTVWISSAHIFNKLPGMLSGPGALFTLILERSFKTPCGFKVNIILEIL